MTEAFWTIVVILFLLCVFWPIPFKKLASYQQWEEFQRKESRRKNV